jgi:Cyclin, C-terminal domain
MDLELLIMKSLNFNIQLPVSYKYYERFARAAFADSPTKDRDFNFGLYLLFIASMYPKIQFDFPQSMIAASCIHCTLRVRENSWFWSDYLHQEVTFYSEESLRQCTSRIIRKYVGLAARRDKKYVDRLGEIEKRFGLKKYCQASAVRPVPAKQSRIEQK